MITSVAIPCALVSVGGVYLVRAPAAACAPLPSGSRVSCSFFSRGCGAQVSGLYKLATGKGKKEGF